MPTTTSNPTSNPTSDATARPTAHDAPGAHAGAWGLPSSIAAASLGLGIAGLGMAMHGRAVGRFHERVRMLQRHIVGASPVVHLRHDLPPAIDGFARRNAGVEGDTIEDPPVAWRMEQSGTMRVSADGAWLPFSADQRIALREPGFTWFAGFGGALDTEVIDAFVGDRGILEARLLGSVPVAHVTGPESDIAEACRYLAELPWAPLAILGNRYLHWSQVAEDVFEVTLHTGSGSATVRLRMEGGDITVAEADERMHVPGQYLPWRGTYGRYERMGGVRIPTSAEVGWIEHGEWRPYWRGDVLAGGYMH